MQGHGQRSTQQVAGSFPTNEPARTPDETVGLDRRQLLKAAAGVAGLLAVGATVTGCDMVVDTSDPLTHLARRTTFGLTGPTLARMRSIGASAWLDEQCDPSRIDTSAVDAKVAQLPHVGATIPELRAVIAAGGEVGSQVRLAALIRQIESPAQLHERMVELWSDHLNVPISDQTLGMLKTIEDRTVIRPGALGRFADLLVASAQSPAMLVYLDNATSKRRAPNENYARELLELHSLGVGNFSEEDVAGTARLLTGWTVNPTTGQFTFNVATHDPGWVSMVGWTRPTAGTPLSHGVSFLTHLARHPATARMVATKVARRFCTDRPSPGLVDSLAAVYTANDTAIVPVLRALFAHREFAASGGAKFRRPLDWFTAVARATGTTVMVATDARLSRLGVTAQSLGQLPFDWPAPNGYPDVEGAWLNAGGLLARWNVAGDLLSGAIGLMVAPVDTLRQGLTGRRTDDAITELAGRVLHEPLTPAGHSLLVRHSRLAGVTQLSPAQSAQLVRTVVPVMLASADFQYR